MKKEYNIDLNHLTTEGYEIIVTRGIEDESNFAFYTIDYNYPNSKYRFFKIDDISGEVLMDEIKFYKD